MSAYTNYYTSSDVSVFIENGVSGQSVNIDTVAGIGWMEGLNTGPVSGLGEERFGFLNSGNVILNGALQINLTHHNYLKCVLETVMTESIPSALSVGEAFNMLSLDQLQEDVKKRRAQALVTGSKAGIQHYPQGFNVRVVFNNGNIYHDDNNKTFLLKKCKIVSSSVMTSVTDDSQVVHEYKFIGREVVT